MFSTTTRTRTGNEIVKVSKLKHKRKYLLCTVWFVLWMNGSHGLFRQFAPLTSASMVYRTWTEIEVVKVGRPHDGVRAGWAVDIDTDKDHVRCYLCWQTYLINKRMSEATAYPANCWQPQSQLCPHRSYTHSPGRHITHPIIHPLAHHPPACADLLVTCSTESHIMRYCNYFFVNTQILLTQLEL